MSRWFRKRKKTRSRETAAVTPDFDDRPDPSRPSPLAELIERRKEDLPAEQRLRERVSALETPPLPPEELSQWVGGGGPHVFQRVGLEVTLELITVCGLQPGDRVLEPGCGCGRNARYLAFYLDRERGGFDGFDVGRPAVEWAQRNITSRYPHFRFEFVDVENTEYNPGGSIRSEDFAFPYEADRFDLVFLPSVFTHMTRVGFEHYVAEIHRVLKPGGRLLSWHFLLDEVSRRGIAAGRSQLGFAPYDDVSWVVKPRNPCAAIAFDESYVLETLESEGIRPQAVIHGSWSGRRPEGLASGQDRVLSIKGAA